MFMFGELDIFDTAQQGTIYTSEEAFHEDYTADSEQPSSGVSLVDWVFSNPFALAIIVGGVILGGVGGLSFKATTPQVVGVVVFSAVFWGAWAAASGIMATVGLPAILIAIITGLHWWVFIAAIVQLSTGTSFDNMA